MEGYFVNAFVLKFYGDSFSLLAKGSMEDSALAFLEYFFVLWIGCLAFRLVCRLFLVGVVRFLFLA